MRCGWLADDPGFVGGAELSQAEFRAAAPVEVVDCPPGGVVKDLDCYVAHNVIRYSLRDLYEITGPVTWYHHDLSPHVDASVRAWLDLQSHIFCSTPQRDAYGIGDWPCVPPPLDLARFRPSRQIRRNGKRQGTCSIAQWLGPNKGRGLVAEWAQKNGPVDVYGPGEFQPVGPNITNHGPLQPEEVAQTLWGYERFVFLPTALEPFGRSVVEAWAAGCEVITNRLIGAREWLEQPEKIESAAEDFWELVLAKVAA